jgi:hypothetical protein
MQNPAAILAAAKGGSGIPATWRVLRPRGSYPVGAGFVGAFVTLLLVFFLSFAAVGLSDATHQNVLGFDPNQPANFVASTLPVLIGVGVGAMVVVGVLSAMWAISRVPYSYFVFTPEGAVQAIGAKKITAIDYSVIDMINTRIQVNRYTTTNQSTGMQTTNTTVSVWGELHYSNGRTVRFKPAGRFGSAESIIQRLINGHREYKAMVGAQRPVRAPY